MIVCAEFVRLVYRPQTPTNPGRSTSGVCRTRLAFTKSDDSHASSRRLNDGAGAKRMLLYFSWLGREMPRLTE